jgi:hypothetical protein
MSSRTTTEKQRRRMLAAREERTREEDQRQMEAWKERVAAERLTDTEEEQVQVAAINAIYRYSDRDRSVGLLRASFPNASEEFLEINYDKSTEIRDKSADIALLYRRDQLSLGMALLEIERVFPGFSNHFYEEALAAGLFLTR